MIRDRIFSSLDRAVQPEFFRRWGGGESGEAEEEEGIVARMDRFLEMSRGGRNNEQLDRKSADRFVSRAILFPSADLQRRNFCRRNDFPFVFEMEKGWKWFCDSMQKF